ncbi:DUF3037 domain-containing protein [Bizionia myxarmorum]|uniref:DUF3037 domain-containing protein n=1 Tax=Bizionia myxarmorum TaxID=291186 RepID=A0A5D0R5R7_9FLAO|nr:DUF3037 domain-containing protein [Bizionia myxarmorum]TYB76882.1 DUF3037 domain-containing protein [Bizionia myxarmorum]
MPDKVPFEYAIIRFVPKVEREEFFNVGVLLFSKRKKFLGIKFHIDEKKFEAFSSEIELADIENYLKSWELVCHGNPNGGAIEKLELSDRFRWLAASKSTILQCSKTHSGLCTNPKETLEGLFESFVL